MAAFLIRIGSDFTKLSEILKTYARRVVFLLLQFTLPVWRQFRKLPSPTAFFCHNKPSSPDLYSQIKPDVSHCGLSCRLGREHSCNPYPECTEDTSFRSCSIIVAYTSSRDPQISRGLNIGIQHIKPLDKIPSLKLPDKIAPDEPPCWKYDTKEWAYGE